MCNKNKIVCMWLIIFGSLTAQNHVEYAGFKSKPCMSFVYDEKAGMYVFQRTKKVNMVMKAVVVTECGLSAALLMDCSRRENGSKEAVLAALFGAVAAGVGYSLVQDVLDEYYSNKKQQPR